MKKVSILFLIILTLATSGYAQTVPDDPHDYLGRLNAITTAVPFLLIAPDSRAGAMGDIGAATSADVNSQAYNPAKYVFNKNTFGVSLSYSPWLRKLVSDINLAYLSTYWKMTDMDAIALSLRYFSLGEIQFTDNQGNPMSVQNPNEFAIDFTSDGVTR